LKKNDPYLPDATAAVEAFEAGIMSMEEALKRVWAAMAKAQRAALPVARYVALTERCDDMKEKEPDAERDALVAKSWTS
jgi:hypothetical protein